MESIPPGLMPRLALLSTVPAPSRKPRPQSRHRNTALHTPDGERPPPAWDQNPSDASKSSTSD